jgi:hypothetical protein
MVKLISKSLKKMIDNEIAKQITSILNVKVNEILMKIPTTFAFGGGKARMNVDVSLLQVYNTPSFSSKRLTDDTHMVLSLVTGTWYSKLFGFRFTISNLKCRNWSKLPHRSS